MCLNISQENKKRIFCILSKNTENTYANISNFLLVVQECGRERALGRNDARGVQYVQGRPPRSGPDEVCLPRGAGVRGGTIQCGLHVRPRYM